MSMMIWLLAVVAQGDSIPEWIEALKSDKIELREAATGKLIGAGETARKAVEALAASADVERSTRARDILRRLDALRVVGGRKVLVAFHGYPIGSPERGTDNTTAHDKAAKDIQDGFARAGVKVLQVVYDSRQSDVRHENPKAGMVHFNQRILVDCGDHPPEEALKDLPYREGAIVFDDGKLTRTLPDPQRKTPERVPAPFAFSYWGAMEWDRRKRDLARYRALRGVIVEEIPQPEKLIGGGGSVILKPAAGVTLLEVFLLTRAEFCYVKEE